MTRQALLADVAPDAHIGPESRIGIIGAGASGLTAAHYLAGAGFEDVILFERRNRVGGKCESIVVDGRVYEMGAVFGAPNYEVIRELAARVGLEEGCCAPSHYYTPRGGRTMPYPWHKYPVLLWQLCARLAWLRKGKYRDVYRPGLAGIHPDLYVNFETFAAKHGLSELPPLFQPISTGFGYGYAEQVPAAYMLKYLSWPMILDCARGKGYVWPEGIQTLWDRMSQEHNVLLDAEVRRVARGENVAVFAGEERFDVDYLILACPLENALSFLDVTAEERDLFSRIHTYDYWVLLCEIEGLPHDLGFIRANFAARNQGHLMLWCCRCAETPLYTLYVLGDDQTSEDVIVANCAADLGQMGARLEKVLATRRWRYFPHVNTADMADGFYEKLEANQGRWRTFYCGEIMSFSNLECSARYARDLVARFSHPRPAGAGRSGAGKITAPALRFFAGCGGE